MTLTEQKPATMTPSACPTQNANIRLDIVTCCVCGTAFGVEMALHRRLRECEGDLYCPNGHGLSYGVTPLQRAQGLLARARKDLARVELERQQIKGRLTRQTNRIAFGVCPCCNRHFGDLQRHMATQHPDFLRQSDAVGKPDDYESTEALLSLPPEDMMTVTEAAHFKNVLDQTVRHAIYKRKLPAIQIKGRYCVPRKAVEEWKVRHVTKVR